MSDRASIESAGPLFHVATGAERILDAHPLSQDLVRIIDLAASCTRKIALKKWLEHKHERIALIALELLLENVSPYAISMYGRN